MKWLFGLAVLLAPAAHAETLLTAHPAAEALARRLTEGTGIEVVAVQPDKLPPSRVASYLAGRGHAGLDEAALGADAVLTFRSFWAEDPLYPAARRANIRIVEIDAAQPLDERMPGMAVLDPAATEAPLYAALGLEPMPPEGEETAPWLSPSRLGEMAEVVTGDLSRLAPTDADQLGQNLAGLKRELLEIKAHADQALAQRDNVDVVALSPQFGYFAADLGLDLRARLIAAPDEWTEARADKLAAWLAREGITTVLTARALPASLSDRLARQQVQVLLLDSTDSGDPAALIARNIATFAK
ncbi:metal ABC transporter solute-binding protein, Zn/Mn family [Paracoccus aminophilus]|uniref:Zinc binding protein n=1 Tax=Paracoccus aminophilus JCM 7686 TaxID=1367847 RepID=S5XTW9_PARAH|nr:zinc ABC transporter substrate-binding protein [Paracoccus aminophilus]AGT08617.1 zinc binding protein [Paracoccus aminophilus JCM 7686]